MTDHYAYGKVECGKQLMKKLNISPSEVLLIGDTTHDYDVANQMGTDCVLIPNGHHTTIRLKALNNQMVSSISDVPDYIFGKN